MPLPIHKWCEDSYRWRGPGKSLWKIGEVYLPDTEYKRFVIICNHWFFSWEITESRSPFLALFYVDWLSFVELKMFFFLHTWIALVCRGLDYSSPWRETYLSSREAIRHNLHILHPSMQTILGICQNKNYATMLITDQSDLRYRTPPSFVQYSASE